ncbi:hypothetical protein OSTOST_00300 [Ostertagia ostertagi]
MLTYDPKARISPYYAVRHPFLRPRTTSQGGQSAAADSPTYQSSRTGQDMWGSQMDCSEDAAAQSFGNSSTVASSTQQPPAATGQLRPAVDETPQFGGHYSHSTGDVFRQPSGPQPHRNPSFDETPSRLHNKVRTFTSQAAHPNHHSNLQYTQGLYN